jgi:hypothetical protein
VLELALHGDIYIVMGVRDSKEQGRGRGRRTIDKWKGDINGFDQKTRCW